MTGSSFAVHHKHQAVFAAGAFGPCTEKYRDDGKESGDGTYDAAVYQQYAQGGRTNGDGDHHYYSDRVYISIFPEIFYFGAYGWSSQRLTT